MVLLSIVSCGCGCSNSVGIGGVCMPHFVGVCFRIFFPTLMIPISHAHHFLAECRCGCVACVSHCTHYGLCKSLGRRYVCVVGFLCVAIPVSSPSFVDIFLLWDSYMVTDEQETLSLIIDVYLLVARVSASYLRGDVAIFGVFFMSFPNVL